MTDELDLLREANPASAETGRWRDRPLDARGEALLERLTSRSVAGRSASRDRRPRIARRAVWGVATAAVATVVALALTVSGTGSSPAVAAPLPLRPRPSSADVSLKDIVRRARSAAAAAPGVTRRGSHVQTWSLAMESGKDAVTVPEETSTRWNKDGSGSTLVVATDPRHPGRPVIDDGVPPRTVGDGKVLRKENYPPGIDGANEEFFETPPTGAAALRDYLAVWYRDADSDPVELVAAVTAFLRVWTPGPRTIAAVATLLSGIKGLRPAGEVTDRLGRKGQTFQFTTGHGRYLIVLDPDDGRVLDIEQTATRDDAAFRLKAGDVLDYTAWLPAADR